MRRQLPSMTALCCFAAFARCLSVTQAAQELNLTQSAVSRQIKQLEEMLGCALVQRVRQRLLLTERGRAYAEEVSLLLDQLEAATHHVREVGAGRLRIGAEPSFTTRWLLPRLGEFSRQYPDIELEIMNDLRRLYERHEGYDVGLLYGDGNWPGFTTRFLMSAEQVVVCTPALLQRHGPILRRLDILHYPLLHHTARAASAQLSSTGLWLGAAGLSRDEIDALPGQRFEHFQFALDAAIHGLGATVIPRFFIDKELEDGKLVIASREPLDTGGYYVAVSRGLEGDVRVRAFSEWLLALVGRNDA